MKNFFGNELIGFVIRIGLAGVLLYAGGIKLFEPHGARDAILAYRIFPPSVAPVLGYALPLLEIALGIFLLIGLFVRLSGIISALLMVGFMAGIISVWVRGYSIDCGCFGGGGDISPEGRNARYTQELIRDFGFTLMALWLARWPRTKFSLERN